MTIIITSLKELPRTQMRMILVRTEEFARAHLERTGGTVGYFKPPRPYQASQGLLFVEVKDDRKDA